MSPLFGSKQEQDQTKGVPIEFVTTLHEYPGFDIVECFGLVTSLSTTAGKGAEDKGRNSLRAGFDRLRLLADEKGANAILGVQVSNFAASMGGVMCDAVGVTLIGTAVRLEPTGAAHL